MKLSTLLVSLCVFALAVFAGNTAPSEITITCSDGSTPGGNSVSCPAGETTFSGTNFHHTHVTVTDGNGVTLDDSGYQPTDGNFSVTENLSAVDTYNVVIKSGKNVFNLTVTTTPIP